MLSKQDSMSSSERELNVIFQFNGHDFDAYEVLGIPAGSPLSEVQSAYADLQGSGDGDSEEIYRLAYEAIARMNK